MLVYILCCSILSVFILKAEEVTTALKLSDNENVANIHSNDSISNHNSRKYYLDACVSNVLNKCYTATSKVINRLCRIRRCRTELKEFAKSEAKTSCGNALTVRLVENTPETTTTSTIKCTNTTTTLTTTQSGRGCRKDNVGNKCWPTEASATTETVGNNTSKTGGNSIGNIARHYTDKIPGNTSTNTDKNANGNTDLDNVGKLRAGNIEKSTVKSSNADNITENDKAVTNTVKKPDGINFDNTTGNTTGETVVNTEISKIDNNTRGNIVNKTGKTVKPVQRSETSTNISQYVERKELISNFSIGKTYNESNSKIIAQLQTSNESGAKTILRSHSLKSLEKACRRSLARKCDFACKFTFLETCITYDCHDIMKRRFKKYCTSQCRTTFRSKKSDDSLSSDSDSYSSRIE